MLKYFKFVFLILVINNSFAQELTAIQKVPEVVGSNGSYVTQITINISSTIGFMKFFQNVPVGCTATEIDSKGGSFSFGDSTAKIIWIAPPEDKQFTISYKVSVSPNASGIKNIKGKIAYLLGDERKTFDLETKTIKISNDAVATRADTASVTNVIALPPPILYSPSKDSIPKETIPSVVNIPPSKEEEKIILPAVEPEKKEDIVTPPVIVAVKEVKKPLTTEAIKEDNKINTLHLPSHSTIPVTAIPSSTGKTFRVQIGAFNLKPEIKGVPEPSKVVLENGMTKFFSGNFTTYEAAAKHKKLLIEKGFQGAFIVLFENGKIVR
ncbi:MAG: SPOR domain-containing protein [Bacteroidota bacterium]